MKTAFGAIAVQILWSSRPGARRIEYLGSARDDGEVEVLKAAARQRLTAGQGILDLGLDTTDTAAAGELLQIVAARSALLWKSLHHAYRVWSHAARNLPIRAEFARVARKRARRQGIRWKFWRGVRIRPRIRTCVRVARIR
ncbi:hypothetical protein [Skermania piniformis]|uniref:Transposase n=1 Tax=Skermania pinensis TaxID=39122 RepID=A0ABX8S9J1_9ACTN|nr:hypothetical protein [Skermania piniformis]QXQ13155.1 hypothetical protein KV203_14870 [Skermania piniformis]